MEIYVYGVSEKGKKICEIIFCIGGEIKAFIDMRAAEIGAVHVGNVIVPCITVDQITNPSDEQKIVIIANKSFLKSSYSLLEYGFKNVHCLFDMNDKKNYFLPNPKYFCDFNLAKPFNEYDSPYPELDKIRDDKDRIYDIKKDILDVNFRIDNQINLLCEMAKIEEPQWLFEDNTIHRYYYNNSWFGRDSAIGLYYMMRYYKPKHIVEIGSGFSTAAMLDVNEEYMNNSVCIRCIEPRIDRLNSVVKESDNIKIMECDLQEVSLSVFGQLKKNDILFIDSSHVCKPRSDVSMEIFEILPRLKSGVIIHFHDIFWPFEYPISWIEQGRVYNEIFVLRAFLMNNDAYDVLLMGNQIASLYDNRIPPKMNRCGCGSLWIRKK